MKKRATSVIALLVTIATIIMAIIVTATGTTTTATFWALVPPIIAIALALITKEVYSSLFLGIVVGSIFACNGSATTAVDHVVSDGLIAAIEGTAGIFLFLVILGVIVALIIKPAEALPSDAGHRPTLRPVSAHSLLPLHWVSSSLSTTTLTV